MELMDGPVPTVNPARRGEIPPWPDPRDLPEPMVPIPPSPALRDQPDLPDPKAPPEPTPHPPPGSP